MRKSNTWFKKKIENEIKDSSDYLQDGDEVACFSAKLLEDDKICITRLQYGRIKNIKYGWIGIFYCLVNADIYCLDGAHKNTDFDFIEKKEQFDKNVIVFNRQILGI